MNLALVAYMHGAGGAERQIVLLGNEMAKRKHRVHLIIVAANNLKYDISDNVIVHDLSSQELISPLKIFMRFWALRGCLKNIKPDIIINYNLQSAYLSLLIGRRICGKILYSERGDPYDKEYSGMLRLVRDFTCKKIDALVFQSEGARDFFRIGEKQKAIVIHNSVTVPPGKYPKAETRDNRIVTVGRLHPQKNPHLLINAFSIIAVNFPDIVLSCYGDGEMHEELQKRINDIGLAQRIHLYPSRKDIFDCIRTARLFVLASDYEGMPNALMEAMALGLPCISTDCRPGGARTLIEDGVNGFIVPVKNAQALADKISFVLDHPEESEEMATKAMLLAETHTNEAIFNRWEEFLYTLLSEQ